MQARFGGVLLFALLLAAPAAGAAGKMITIPEELFRLMTGISPNDLAVGTVPEQIAARIVIPEGSRIVGTANRYGQTSVHLVSAESEETLRAILIAALERKGWKKAPDYPRRSGGFVREATGTSTELCGEKDSRVGLQVRPWGKSTLVSYHLDDVNSGRCGASSVYGPEQDEVSGRFPELRPVDGMKIRQIGSSSGGSGSYRRRSEAAAVDSGLSPAAVVQAFTPQLREQGWRLDLEAPLEQGFAQIWSYRDDDIRLYGTLIALESASGKVVLEMTIGNLE